MINKCICHFLVKYLTVGNSVCGTPNNFHLFLCIIFPIVNGEELLITPPDDPHIQALGRSVLFTCGAVGFSSPEINPYIKWYDQTGDEITDRTGR